MSNDPKTIAKLLRAISAGTMARVSGHDIIFETAALLIDVLPDGRERLLQEHSLLRSQLVECNKEIARLRSELMRHCGSELHG